ncbi:MAG: hypothetical protein HFI82_04980 [Eubacterium sp.]|nr:hypothetical protein [Eubacterium sp.]
MINYSRLGYEIKRDFTNFSFKISKGLKRPQKKKENITLKKTIDRLSRNLFAFDNKDFLMHN